MLKPSPTEFASGSELSGNGAGIYHLTDHVSTDEFEAGLAEAKAEGEPAEIVRRASGASVS